MSDRDPAPPDVDELAKLAGEYARLEPPSTRALATRAFRAGFEAARPVVFAAGVRAAAGEAAKFRVKPSVRECGPMPAEYYDGLDTAAQDIERLILRLLPRDAAGGREGQP